MSLFAQTQDFPSDDVIERRSAEEPLNEGDYPATVETLSDQADGATADPYFSEGWSDGQVTLDGGDEYDNVQLRYDIYRNRLLIRGKDGEATPLNPEKVRSFTVGPPRLANLARFQRAKYLGDFDEVPDEQFVQVIYQSESALLAVHRKDVASASQASSNQLGATVTDYYYVSPKGEIAAFEPNREAVLDLFSDRREAMQTFIQETMLDFDNVADLARLVAFYDQQP
jgi:hypothetical protein